MCSLVHCHGPMHHQGNPLMDIADINCNHPVAFCPVRTKLPDAFQHAQVLSIIFTDPSPKLDIHLINTHRVFCIHSHIAVPNGSMPFPVSASTAKSLAYSQKPFGEHQ